MAEKIAVPNLEAKAADGNPVFTPKQWFERFRQFTKREHKIDITPLIKGERSHRNRMDREREIYPGRFYLWSGTRSTVSNYPSRV